MSRPVFISYARSTSRHHGEAFHRELGTLSFFDTSDIETGEQSSQELDDALPDAKVVIIFEAERYFQRWYCRKELKTALKSFEILSTQSGSRRKNRMAHLRALSWPCHPTNPDR